MHGYRDLCNPPGKQAFHKTGFNSGRWNKYPSRVGRYADGNLLIRGRPNRCAGTKDVTAGAEVWEELYRAVHMPHLDPVVTGFNACIDRIIPVTGGLLRSLEMSAVLGAEPLRTRLVRAMRNCTADEWFVTDPDVYRSLADLFRTTGNPVAGGQAGIAALHLQSIGVPAVTCAIPGAGPQVRAFLQQAGICTLAFSPEEDVRTEAVHLVFEYPPGLIPAAEGVTPRSSRFIASPLHDPSTVLVPAGAMEDFLASIAPCRRAFLSGYQYLRTGQDFITAASQLCRIRAVHPLMRTHVEFVTVTDPTVLSMMLRHILPNADSIGLNERELWLLHGVLEGESPVVPAAAAAPPFACMRAALALAEATGVARIHLHTFGYYVLVLDAGSAEPERSRDALILAARAAAGAAGGGDQRIPQTGLSACETLRDKLGDGGGTGIFTSGSRVVIAVPACIAQGIWKTTGLGDIISSTAFVADRF